MQQGSEPRIGRHSSRTETSMGEPWLSPPRLVFPGTSTIAEKPSSPRPIVDGGSVHKKLIKSVEGGDEFWGFARSRLDHEHQDEKLHTTQ